MPSLEAHASSTAGYAAGGAAGGCLRHTLVSLGAARHSASTPARAPRLRGSKAWGQRKPGGHGERTNGRAVSIPRARAVRSERPAVILSSPAVPVSRLALGHPDTHRVRTGSTSPLGAIAARRTGDRDAAWHGPQGSGAASEQMDHQSTWVTHLSSGDLRGVRAPSPELDWVLCSGPPALLVHASAQARGEAGVSPRVARLAAWLIPASLEH